MAIRTNDFTMQTRIFPLRAGVPYKTRDGKHVVLENVPGLFSYMNGDNGWAYSHSHGYVLAHELDPRDIVDYFIEEGTWELRNGEIIDLRRPDPMPTDGQYPFWGFDAGTNNFRYSYTAEGRYYNSHMTSQLDIASYVGRTGLIVEPEGVLHSGCWLRRDNKIVTLRWKNNYQLFEDFSGTEYSPALDGRVNAGWFSTLDLIRPATTEERDEQQSYFYAKSYMGYAREGFFRQYGIIQLVVMPPVWKEFIIAWAELRDKAGMDKDSMFCSGIARDMEMYPNEITYQAEQMYLCDRYRVQQNSFSRFYGRFIEGEDGTVRMITPMRIPSRIREHDSLRGFNSPTTTKGAGCTFNPLTNWYAEIEREVATKERRGEYKEMPSDFPTKWGTGVHISTQNANLLAYYPTLRHWQRRVPQQIKAGRYLKQFFPELSDDQIRRLSAEIGTGELRFYSDWYDMFKVYRDLDANGVVSSCMSKDSWGSIHPLMVYHNSDVELAVLYMGDKPVARALYNKHNKHYPMVYGQWEKMYVALTDAGFVHDSLCGAKIRRLPRRVSSECPTENGFYKIEKMGDYDRDSDTVLMPYIDHKRDLDRSSNCSTSVDVMDHYIVIRYDGSYDANNHDHAYVDLNQGRCTCEHCGDHADEEDMYYLENEEISICERCYNRHTVQVYTSYRNSFTCMRDTADSSYVWVDAADRYFQDSEAAMEAGYCWSDEDDCWYHESDCVYVEELSDYICSAEIGKYIMWDEEESEYVTTETYNERVAEREQQSQEAA